MAELSRNDPCHCGSGKKYKKCHLDEDLALARQVAAGGPATPAEPVDWMKLLLVPTIVGLALLVGVTVWRSFGDGLIVAGGWAIAATCWHVFRDPPPPRSDAGDPAALNFGRSNDS